SDSEDESFSVDDCSLTFFLSQPLSFSMAGRSEPANSPGEWEKHVSSAPSGSGEVGEVAEPPAVDVSSPPDGGLKAWTQVLMGHLVLINSWGYLTSFGLIQSYYVTAPS